MICVVRALRCGDGAVGWTGGHNQGGRTQERQRSRPLAHLVYQDRVSCKRRMWALSLPGFMGHRVVGIDGEVVGLVGVVLVIGVEGADPNLLVGRQVVDLNRLAGKGIGTAVDRDDTSMERGQIAEGLDPRARLRTAGADEIVLEAAADGAQLRRGSGMGDDAISRGREGGTSMRLRLRVRYGRGRLPAGSLPAGSFRAGSFRAGSFRAGSFRAGSFRAELPAGSLSAGPLTASLAFLLAFLLALHLAQALDLGCLTAVVPRRHPVGWQ